MKTFFVLSIVLVLVVGGGMFWWKISSHPQEVSQMGQREDEQETLDLDREGESTQESAPHEGPGGVYPEEEGFPTSAQEPTEQQTTLMPLPLQEESSEESSQRKSSAPPDEPSQKEGFSVNPYLVYPADKAEIPAYEQALRQYLEELQGWYEQEVGLAFLVDDLRVVRSSRNYLEMRCGEEPQETCINDRTQLEGNWAQYMNEAIHGGTATYYEGGPSWTADIIDLVFGAGGGGYAGGNSNGNNSGWAVMGDWVLEPISGVPNEWGIPCSLSDGWQCSGGMPKGTPAHELGHAFGLPHPGEEYVNQTIMQWHGNFPEPGLLPSEIEFLRASPFF